MYSDTKPGSPLSGVPVTLAHGTSPPVTVLTDENGVFEVYDLPPGPYTVSIAAPNGLAPKFGYVSGPRTFSQDFPLTLKLGDSDATAVFYLIPSTAR